MARKFSHFKPFVSVAQAHPLRRLGDLFRGLPLVHRNCAEEAQPIPLDVAESDRNYTITAAVPGVTKDDIKVAIDGKQVSIRAAAKKNSAHKKETVMFSERFYGPQYRSVSLSQDVDEANAVAKYHDGILELTLPKLNGGHRKQLAIQ